jgi:DNA-binding MurR/RpiR family transcriptional regulator
MKMNISDIERRLIKVSSALSPNRALILQSILSSSEETFYLSARQLAKRYEVDPATITRTVRDLGYESFSDFSEALRAHFVKAVTPLQTFTEEAKSPRTDAQKIELSFVRAEQNLNRAARETKSEAIFKASRYLMNARKIMLVGGNLMHGLAFQLGYSLAILGATTIYPQQNIAMIYNSRTFTSEDVLVVFAFRKTLQVCIDTAVLARKHGAYVICISDSEQSLVGLVADQNFVVSISSPVFTSSLVAITSLIEALIMGCALVSKDKTTKYLEHLDDDYRHGSHWFQGDPEALLLSLPPKLIRD